eukprot:PLAT3132.1.p1 GENE.PLAT3132.1~~PLAT3132.1.p1  ORF type:complete len:918 (+),score=369.32 PLAT3132.1:19-2772(+)
MDVAADSGGSTGAEDGLPPPRRLSLFAGDAASVHKRLAAKLDELAVGGGGSEGEGDAPSMPDSMPAPLGRTRLEPIASTSGAGGSGSARSVLPPLKRPRRHRRASTARMSRKPPALEVPAVESAATSSARLLREEAARAVAAPAAAAGDEAPPSPSSSPSPAVEGSEEDAGGLDEDAKEGDLAVIRSGGSDLHTSSESSSSPAGSIAEEGGDGESTAAGEEQAEEHDKEHATPVKTPTGEADKPAVTPLAPVPRRRLEFAAKAVMRMRKRIQERKREMEAAAAAAAKPVKTVEQYIEEICDIYRFNEEKVRRLPPLIFHPETPARLLWDCFILLLVFFYTIAVPVRVAFDLDIVGAAFVVDIIADVLFIADMLLNFRTAFKRDAVLVTDPWECCKRYATSWFPLDFVASVPVGLFLGSNISKFNKILRVLRIFKLFRIFRLGRYAQKLEESLGMNPSVVRFVKSVCVLLGVWHMIGCSYWAVAIFELDGIAQCADNRDFNCFRRECLYFGDCDGSKQRMTGFSEATQFLLDHQVPNLWLPHPGVANMGLSSQYLHSVFWAVEVTTGIGDDISPVTDIEIMFTTGMTLVGLILYSVIIGSASSALANMDSTSTRRKQTLDRVTEYLRYRNVPQFFQKIIKDYYDHLWASPTNEHEVLQDLPEMLRMRLGLVLNRDLVQRVPIFQAFSAETFISLIQMLHPVTYVAGEFIVKQGDSGHAMYFIKRGKVEVLLGGYKRVDIMHDGDYFGERALLHSEPRSASCRAVEFCDILVLERSDFNKLLEESAEFTDILKKTLAARMQNLHSRQQEMEDDPEPHPLEPSMEHMFQRSRRVSVKIAAESRRAKVRARRDALTILKSELQTGPGSLLELAELRGSPVAADGPGDKPASPLTASLARLRRKASPASVAPARLLSSSSVR